MKKKVIGILICMTLMLPALSVTAITNEPPNKPVITGPTRGKWGVEYTFCIINATDPDGDDVWGKFSWGDGTYSEWIGPYSPREDFIICASRTFEFGSYTIKAKLKDEWGLESEWSDPLAISIPMNQQSNSWWFLQFLQNHPRMFPIIRHLLGL